MASEKQVVLLFSPIDKKEISTSTLPALNKFYTKGACLNNIKHLDNAKTIAGSGNIKGGETIWEAAEKADFIVDTLDKTCDMSVVDMPADAKAIEAQIAILFEKLERNSIIVLIADNAVFFYGLGIAKGKVIDTEACICTVAPTVAYIADFPVPENCIAPVCYDVLKDRNFKLKEIQKLQNIVKNMEAAVERGARQPWDKHDCA